MLYGQTLMPDTIVLLPKQYSKASDEKRTSMLIAVTVPTDLQQQPAIAWSNKFV